MTPEIVQQIVAALNHDQRHALGRINSEKAPLQSRLTAIRNRRDAAYVDKLEGKISEEFWKRKEGEWRLEEQQIKLALDGQIEARIADDSARKVFKAWLSCYRVLAAIDRNNIDLK